MSTFALCVLCLPLVACAAQVAEPSSDDGSGSLRGADDTDEGNAARSAAPKQPCEAVDSGNSYAACVTSKGDDGVQQCEDDGGRGPCAALASCDPRVGSTCYTIDSDGGMNLSYRSCVISKGTWDVDHAFDSSCSTPLVLAFHGEAVSFTHPAGTFDLVGAGASFDHDWVSSATPWLALDLDGNGSIDDGAELFGSMTRLPNGQRAQNGFEALQALDDDGDGKITARDAVWSRLVIWADTNQDRRSSSSELTPVASRDLVAVDLGYESDRRCTGTACEVERARFEWKGGTGAVIDVHFAAR